MAEDLGLGVFIDPTGAVKGSEDAKRAFDGMKKAATESEKSIKALNGVMNELKGLFAGITIVATFNALTNAAKEFEQNTLRLNTQLKRLGDQSQITAGFIDDLADSFSNISGFDDDEIKRTTIGLLEMGLQSRKAITDVTQLGIALAALKPELGGVENATNMIARALKNPEMGLRALRATGIAFNTEAMRTVEILAKQGDAAEAAAVLVNELEKAMGGSAEVIAASLDTIEGKQRALATSWGNLLETFGTSETFINAAKFAIDALRVAIIAVDTYLKAFGHAWIETWKSIGDVLSGEWTQANQRFTAIEGETKRILKEGMDRITQSGEGSRRTIKAVKQDYEGFSKTAVDGLEKTKKKTAELDETTKKLVDTLEGGLTDAFTEMFKTGEISFSNLFESFRSMLAKMSAQALVNPIIIGIKQDVLGQLSGTSGATSGSSSGGGIFSNGFSLPNIDIFGSSGGGSFINSIGSSLGFATPYAVDPAVFGVSQLNIGSGIFGSTTLGSAIGNAGYGMIGSTLSSLLGLGGGGMASTALSTVGSLAGSALGGPIGAIAGGFIGDALGGLFGGKALPSNNTAAANFNNLGQVTLHEDKANDNTRKLRDSFVSGVQQMFSAITSITNGTARFTPFGFDIGERDPTSIYKNGLAMSGKQGDFQGAAGDVKGALDYIATNLSSFVSGLSGMFDQVIKKGGDFQKVMENLGFAKAYTDIVNFKKPLSDVQQLFKGLTDQYNELVRKTNELNATPNKIKGTGAGGILGMDQIDFAKIIRERPDVVRDRGTSPEALYGWLVSNGFSEGGADYFAKASLRSYSKIDLSPATNSLRKQLNDSISEAIMGIDNPMQLALNQFDADAKARLDYAKLIGADINAVEKYNALAREQILKQYGQSAVELEAKTAAERLAIMQKSAEQIKAFLNQQLLGETSTLSPWEKYQEAQRQFQNNLATARTSGDTSELVSSAGTLLQLGQEALGGATADYATLQNFTRQTLTNLARDLKLPGFAYGGSYTVGGSSGVDSRVVAFKATAGEQIEVTPAGGGSTVQAISQQTVVLASEIRNLAAEVVEMRKENEKLRMQGSLERRAVG